MNDNIQIHFLGAAGTVTGSKYLIEVLGKKIMVDCGLFQGLKKLRNLNWDTFPVNVSEIDAVLLTHAHLDHTGYLPRLVKSGFKGKIYGTAPTLDIAEIILRDSAKIQEEEAAHANKYEYSKHKPAKPLYNLKDVDRTLSRFEEVQLDQWLPFFEGIKVRYQYNGHILGATFIEMDAAGKRLVFSGDIGREEDYLLFSPKRPERADFLFIESTYGDRLHSEGDIEQELLQHIEETYQDGGTLIIPSFAVERTQTLMYLLWKLREKGLMPNIPVYMDSPMGAKVLDVFHRSAAWHKLPEEDCNKMCDYIQTVSSFRETWAIIDDKSPKIVIAGSGMVTGGRVLTYLTKYLERPETRLLLVGYQAEGTRGRQLQEGAHEVKIYGKYYSVSAKIVRINGLSAHADQRELLNWMGGIKNTPEKVFIVHGEAHAADVLRVKIKDEFGWDCIVPELYSIETIELQE
ncbi:MULTISPECIES: MBL fold metallo-hydrolase [Saprospirales]|jgi:metallo-beta-lactamase family protein|uniref:MBL fold metallo-hydrolase RNA specificity domain-containing protein n=1 Tax=Saprospirales TaxID=1936988 RepID=UPI00037C406C|nr:MULTISPECIES: MBL fold metallo-hydrolase [Saprospirales]MCI5092708.1 MBL fold metallo-hydrolase [Phaeodactylibacter sp.]